MTSSDACAGWSAIAQTEQNPADREVSVATCLFIPANVTLGDFAAATIVVTLTVRHFNMT